jgi:hypothetical protein
MTLNEIEIAANRGNIAGGDFGLKHTLRYEVLPEFYRKVSEADPTWLKKTSTLSIVTSTRVYNLPQDFRSMVGVYYQAPYAAKPSEVRYIGENPQLVAMAEIVTAPSRPLGYYIIQRTDNKKFRALKIDRPADTSYTFPYIYRSRLIVSDDIDDTELDQYIPEEYQQALIAGLRREILLDRFGQGDQRAGIAASQFEEIIDQARNSGHDLARRNLAIYCD